MQQGSATTHAIIFTVGAEKEKIEGTASQLAEDAATLIRVRNRFSNTPDSRLPNVMTALLPKLFHRLEGYSQLSMTSPPLTAGATSSISATSLVATDQRSNPEIMNLNQMHLSNSGSLNMYKKRAQEDIFGILSNAMERLRGNSTLPTATLVSALLPFIRSPHPVVCTWALAFLQVSLPRVSIESIDRTTIACLMTSLAEIHHDLILVDYSYDGGDADGEDDTIAPSVVVALETRWIRISWLLLDSIMIYSGHRPLVDWDAETFDPRQSQGEEHGTPSSQQTQHQHAIYRKALAEETFKEVHPLLSTGSQKNRDTGIAIMNLFLDLILFWPGEASSSLETGLSASGLTRINFRSKISANGTGAEVEQEQNRARLRREQHPGLPAQFQRHMRPRSVALNKWSDMSKVYLRYLKLACFKFAVWKPEGAPHYSGHQRDRALFLSILAANQDSMHGREAMGYINRRNDIHGTAPVSISVATSTLILILGETGASPILDKFEEQYGTGCWEEILGPRTKNKASQRPALPWGVSSRAAGYLLKAPLQWERDPAMDEAYSTLLIELALGLSKEVETDRKFLSIQLLACFVEQLQSSPAVLPDIFVAIVAVLKVVVDQGASDNDDLRNTPPRPGQQPLGVPAPFNHRNDLNRLLQSHRQSLKRKTMKHDGAIKARQETYKLIPRLSKLMFACESNRPFEIPNLLLQCAVHEDRLLEHYVVEALDASLSEYVRMLDAGLEGGCIEEDETLTSFRLGATTLLPSLVEATCSEVVAARSVGMEWIAKLLVKMDPEAALYLASRLVDDENRHVAKVAQCVLNSNPCIKVEEVSDSIVWFGGGEGEDLLSPIQAEINHRISQLADTLRLSRDEARIILLHHGFSIMKAASAYKQDSQTIRDLCGFVCSDNIAMEQAGEVWFCGICYEDMDSSNGYSLGCGHYFCDNCWKSYVVDASENCKSTAMTFLDLRCPQHHCNALVTKSLMNRTVPYLLPKWNEALLQTFIEIDHSYRFCPGPDCGCVAVASPSSRQRAFRTATCESCSTSFCFQCGEVPHAPATCSDMRAWGTLMGSSGFWIKQNSKPCPGCNAPIEKNTGCNHMKCSKCQTDFCWLCLALLNHHMESHICNRYDPADSAENDFERHALFTASRYHAHDEAELFALSQSNNHQPHKLIEAFWFLDEDEDPEILCEALRIIVKARSFLKYSYVASFGLRKDPKRLKIHEGHHSCLEVFTERLSQLAETNLQRLYLEEGERGVKSHFRRLAFYTISVVRYTERITDLAL